MKYNAITFDGAQILFDEKHLATVEQAMADKQPVRLNGALVQGSSIARIEEYKEQGSNFGNTLQLGAEEIFQLESGEKTVGFWEVIFNNNWKRREQGKPWLYAPFVEYAKRESGLTSPQEVLEFIEAESENLDWTRNKSEVKREAYDRENREMIKKYLETDEGREYAMKQPKN